MAYSHHHSSALGFSSSCLDGVPFKVGPKFKPPQKIILPPELQGTLTSQTLKNEYTFELEEGVLKWTEDRERQLEAQRQAEQEKQAARARQAQQSPQSGNSSDSSEEETPPGNTSNRPAVENGGPFSYTAGMPGNSGPQLRQPLRPAPAIPPRSNYANVVIPNPLLANVSNDILTPTPIGPAVKSGKTTDNQKNGIDLTQFEKIDDPFDNLELQTINDMEELKTVLEGSRISPAPVTEGAADGTGNQVCSASSGQPVVTVPDDIFSNGAASSSLEIDGSQQVDYENLSFNKGVAALPFSQRKEREPSPVDISKLPPVPARRGLVAKSNPLPPIGRQSFDVVNSVDITKNNDAGNVSQSLNFEPGAGTNLYENTISAQPQYDNIQSFTGAMKKPPRMNKYSRHLEQEEPAYVNLQKVDNGSAQLTMNVMFCNAKSNPDLTTQSADSAERSRPVPAPRRSRSPPSRPSSQQAWNRYSPLPPTSSNTAETSPSVSKSSSNGDICSPSEADTYSKLSQEARRSVDNIVNMGFSRPQVVRAVERLGEDQKEVVEHLCLVDQLAEKGFDRYLAETALLLFHNNSKQASEYLELYKQFSELGFQGEKIKEALVNTSNDREKSLDILTASS